MSPEHCENNNKKNICEAIYFFFELTAYMFVGMGENKNKYNNIYIKLF